MQINKQIIVAVWAIIIAVILGGVAYWAVKYHEANSTTSPASTQPTSDPSIQPIDGTVVLTDTTCKSVIALTSVGTTGGETVNSDGSFSTSALKQVPTLVQIVSKATPNIVCLLGSYTPGSTGTLLINAASTAEALGVPDGLSTAKTTTLEASSTYKEYASWLAGVLPTATITSLYSDGTLNAKLTGYQTQLQQLSGE